MSTVFVCLLLGVWCSVAHTCVDLSGIPSVARPSVERVLGAFEQADGLVKEWQSLWRANLQGRGLVLRDDGTLYSKLLSLGTRMQEFEPVFQKVLRREARFLRANPALTHLEQAAINDALKDWESLAGELVRELLSGSDFIGNILFHWED